MAIGHTVSDKRRFFDFSKMAAVHHLGFVMFVLGQPTNGIWWSLSLCKISWNRCSSLNNMHVFRLREFGLKTPIHASKIGIWGLTP